MNPAVESRAYARAGLLGNPSDGYGGKTISFVFDRYFASVELTDSAKVVIQSAKDDRLDFDSPQELSDHIRDHGFYGGVRLIKSAIKRLNDYCRQIGIPFDRPFKIRYCSNIPRQVGLAGSSAIAIATMRSLCQWNEMALDPAVIAALATESEHALGIAAGPQDRVIQSFEGTMYMNFSQSESMDGLTCGHYTRLTIPADHHFYVAFNAAAGEPTEVLHGDLQSKMKQGDPATVSAIRQIAELAEQGKEAIESNNLDLLAELIDANFDLRKQVCNLNPFHVRMIDAARTTGASAKYCGSGGAIVGTYPDSTIFQLLEQRLGSIGCTVIRPTILEPTMSQAVP